MSRFVNGPLQLLEAVEGSKNKQGRSQFSYCPTPIEKKRSFS